VSDRRIDVRFDEDAFAADKVNDIGGSEVSARLGPDSAYLA
jgi:hypothetical protein